MDLSKIGSKAWSEPGVVPQSKEAVHGLKKDIHEGKVTNQIGDLLQLSRSRSSRQYMLASASTNVLPTGTTGRLSGIGGENSARRSDASVKRPKHGELSLANVHERPATRLEIEGLYEELQQRTQAVSENPSAAAGTCKVTAYKPHKDAVALIRDRMKHEFSSCLQGLPDEPWLEGLIKCESLRDICDSTSSRLTDMLSVTSLEYGNVLRKLRLTYRLSHEQMRLSWVALRERHLKTCSELDELKATNISLEAALRESEQDIRSKIDAEVFDMRKSYEEERGRDREHVLKTEQHMAEMSLTLRDLNALFKTMQGDADAAMASDTMARCRRLEQEVQDLEQTVSVLAKTKEELHQEQKRCKHQEAEINELKSEIGLLSSTVNRQDETIANLMGREAMHNAEIEKLKKMAADAKEKEEDLEFDQTATALLCIKCKKSLDDLSNIRDAVLGSIKPTEKLMCQNFRILLPNLKGRRPSRDSVWVRKCMRAIMLSKMREVCAMMPLGVAGHVTGFPEFVYAWFDPVILPPSGALTVSGSSTSKGSAAAAAYLKADEDRWGFYYGVKAMSRENMEAKLLWSLLDQAQGEDGLAFVMNCMSIALSLGGTELWAQFGDTSGCDSINSLHFAEINIKHCGDTGEKSAARNLPPTIWLRIGVAKHAVRLILVRALEPQMHAAMDAIEALKGTPDLENPLVEEDDQEVVISIETIDNGFPEADTDMKRKLLPSGPEPSHIDLFVWLRILLQRFQEEQSHRAAAIRLMFDTASVGALTAAPTQPSIGNNVTNTDYLEPVKSGSESAVVLSLGSNGAGGDSHVEYPQFSAILRTLHPSISASESAALFGICYELGVRKVTANVFLKVAESARLFSRSMRLISLPLLRRNSSCLEEDDVVTNGGFVDKQIKFKSRMETPVSVDVEQKVRKTLGAFVHSRARMMESEVHRMAKDLPERWRMVLLETYVDLNNAIVENFSKIRAAQRMKNSADRNVGSLSGAGGNEKRGLIQCHLDGIQPYLLYRKLLSFMLLFDSLCDNPLLPGDLLSAPIATSASARRGFGTAANYLTNCISLHNARSIIISIEHAVLGKRYKLSTVAKFETIRNSISARRIQHMFLRVSGSKELAVPLVLRNLMQAGYLTGRGRGPTSGYALSQRGLRARKVYMEPWCAQAVIAEILYFKIMFDRKARSCNLPVIDLRYALIVCHWNLWGCSEMAELSIHDFCTAVRNYMHGLPRLRIFAAFLGFSDLEQPISGILTTPLALNMYLQLILCIHQECLKVVEEDGKITEPLQTILFPCMENPLLRPDKRDFWKCDPEILLAAVNKWSFCQPPQFRPVYSKIFEKFNKLIDRDGLLDVDDVLWSVMQTWAKIMIVFAKRVDDHSAKRRRDHKGFFSVEPKTSVFEDRRNIQVGEIAKRRLKAELNKYALPRYPSDVADTVCSLLEGVCTFNDVEETDETLKKVDSRKIALTVVNQILKGGAPGVCEIISKNQFNRPNRKYLEIVTERNEEKRAIDAIILSASDKLAHTEAGNSEIGETTGQYMKDLLIWEINTSSAGENAPPPTSSVSDVGDVSGSVDIFSRFGGPADAKGNRKHSHTGAYLLNEMPIASAVSATISMWHLVRVWSALSDPIATFLEMASEDLNSIIEHAKALEDSDRDKCRPIARVHPFLSGASENKECDMGVKAAMDSIDDARDVCHSLHISCGTGDSKASGSMPRSSSTVVNPSTDYNEETTAEAWAQMRLLLTTISKVSIVLSIPFPYDDGNSKSTSGRKLQLEKASVYMIDIEGPHFSSS